MSNLLERSKAALLAVGVPPAEALAKYMALLLEINESINLTGAKTPEDLALKHIADVFLARQVVGDFDRPVVDVGSGGGIPGIPLAILVPNLMVTLVEKTQKKASCLDQLIDRVGVRDQVRVIAKPLEEAKGLPREAEFWFRGFLPGPKLALFLSRAFPKADAGPIVLMKGPAWGKEKIEILQTPGVKEGWMQRIAESTEQEYELPQGAGQRVLVHV